VQRRPELTLEQIDALELPELPVRRVSRDFYYPFFNASWDEGKIYAYELAALPRWTKQFFETWMFRGIDHGDNETVVVKHGWEQSGKIVLRPKKGTVHQTMERMAPLMHYAGTSSEQKSATIQLLAYRLFDLVEEVQPRQRVW